jgi:hypothetical protein
MNALRTAILMGLALLPLLSLVPLHWYATQGMRCCLHKAFWLAFSGSLFWGLLGAYPGCEWLSFPLLVTGASLSAFCEWMASTPHLRRLKTCLALSCFSMVFLSTELMARHTTWMKHDHHVHAFSILSHFQGLSNLH